MVAKLEIHLLANQLHALIASDREGLTFYVDVPIGSEWRVVRAGNAATRSVAHHLVGEYVAAPDALGAVGTHRYRRTCARGRVRGGCAAA